MNFSYTDKELRHKQIMEALAKPCRSNKKGFIEGETQKLDAIRELLTDSGYHEILLNNSQIWRKDLSAPIDVVISSHADIVKQITKCSSVLSDNGYYKGTYDNAGPASALVAAMLERNLPDNILIAFTADEETGRCNGAKQVLEYARNSGNEPICIALDVTYEGYDNGHLFTVENLSSGHKKNEDFEFLNNVGNAILSMDTDKQSCTFVRLNKHAIPEVIDTTKYMAKDSGDLDEAYIYVYEHARAFSLCLPCDGEMHGNSGVYVRQPEFEGYINAIEGIISMMSKDVNKDAVVARVKEENTPLIEKCLELVAEEKALEEERRQKLAESRKGWYTPASYGYCGTVPREYSGEMSEDEYYDYMAYNSSFGIEYADMIESPPSYYEPEVYGSFKNYVDSVIEEIADVIFEYDYGDDESREDFVAESMSYIPEDVVDYYGGSYHMVQVLNAMYNSAFGIEGDEKLGEYDEDVEEEAYCSDCSHDSDGYEYESSLFDLLKDDSYDEEKHATEIELADNFDEFGEDGYEIDC